MKKIISTIISVIEWIICLILVVLVLLTAFQKFSNQGNFFGYRIYTIASGSMIPTYNIGDTLLIKEMPASEINVGDAVTYQGEASGVDGMIITHQVVEVGIDENGKYYFHTKGIANNIEDPIVYEDQVLGKVVYKFFTLSILGRITTNMWLLFIFVILPIAFLVAVEIIKIVFKSEDEEKAEIEEEVEELESKLTKKDKKNENKTIQDNDKSDKMKIGDMDSVEEENALDEENAPEEEDQNDESMDVEDSCEVKTSMEDLQDKE